MQRVRVAIWTLTSGSAQQPLSLLDRERFGWPALVAGGRPEQRGHVPTDQMVGLGLSDSSHEAVVRDLQDRVVS